MNEGLVPRRYAKALYEFALEKGVQERVYTMMKSLAASFAANGGLQSTLANPYVGVADKKGLLVTAASADKSDIVYADFLKLLAENRRLDMARDIALAYIGLYRKANDIHEVTVTSAYPLKPAESARLKALVECHIGANATVEFSEAVNPQLIGGFTVAVGNERLDASLSNELKQLRLNLSSK
ncbi:MAG: ATP synthase F1 subunit delta [Paramuribaculum sp.]|nr:ATP synthase F1 subunit delta [Paramuribaculum sp.]